LIQDKTLETKRNSGDLLLSVNVPNPHDSFQNIQKLNVLLFTDVKDINGNSYSWDKKEDVELISMAFKALNPAVPADANIRNRLDSNLFPASCDLELCFPLSIADPQTGEITNYDEASFYWNADTGTVRCDLLSPEGNGGSTTTGQFQIDENENGMKVSYSTQYHTANEPEPSPPSVH
jgi:hypothetical protein